MTGVQEKKIPLSSLLNSLTKDELHDIRRMLEVQGMSQMNKSELVQRLSSYMIDHLEQHLGRIDLDRYRLLMKVMKAKNSILPIIELTDQEQDHYEPIYYHMYGFLFLRDGAIIMPDEVRERLFQVGTDRFLAVLDRNQEWIQLTRGLLYYYGNMGVQDLVEKVEHLTGRKVDYLEYWHIIRDLEPYDYSVIGSEYGFSHFKVDDPQLIDQEHRQRPQLEYYPVTKAQALRAADDEYVERHAGFQQFVSFIRKHWEMDAEEADLLTAELVDQIQQGDSPSELIASLQEQLDFTEMDVLQQLADRLMSLVNKTRLWALKGHSPEELSAVDRKQPQLLPQHPINVQGATARTSSQAGSTSPTVYNFETKMKVGRNDPCPCGSGKKFKKCCGTE